MAYSTNPNLPKARALAMRLLNQEDLPLQVVANRCGVHRSTIYRWKQKWLEINSNVQLQSFNRPTRISKGNISTFRATALKWVIPTLTSKPNYSPNKVPDNILDLVLKLRQLLKRCAEVVWWHLVQDNQVNISLSSVRRILKRHHYISGRKHRVRPSNPMRPLVTKPGELVQTDTVHYVNPLNRKRKYVYTVIDLFTRMTYAEIHSHIRPGIAAQVVLHASDRFGFNFQMVQADNGPEYSHYFEDTLARKGMPTRHSRLHRPNDNAHIDRFNRTVQEECVGRYLDFSVPNRLIQAKLNNYLELYNTKRVHLRLQYRQPNQMLQSS